MKRTDNKKVKKIIKKSEFNHTKEKTKKNRISENLIAVSMVFFGIFTAFVLIRIPWGFWEKGMRFLFLGIFGKLAFGVVNYYPRAGCCAISILQPFFL